MSNWKLICKLDDIPQLGSRIVQPATGGDIAIFRTADDKVFACTTNARTRAARCRRASFTASG